MSRRHDAASPPLDILPLSQPHLLPTALLLKEEDLFPDYHVAVSQSCWPCLEEVTERMGRTDGIVLHHAQGAVDAGPAEGAVVAGHGHGEEADGDGAGFG